MPLIAGIGSSQSVGPTSGGKVTPVTVTTSGAQVIGINPSRVTITFHNPGSQNLYVYQMNQANGQPLNPTLSALAGTFQIFPGAFFVVSGECQVAWGALAASGATNPLTIMESNV